MKFRQLILLIVIAVVMYATNPGQERHEDKIRESFDDENPVAGALGVGWLRSKTIEYSDYRVLSLSRIDDDLVSIGLFGMVFVLNIESD
jgi:hypothetical protein